VIAACTAVAVAVGVLGWWENVFVSIVTILVGAFGCMCIYDVALLMTACITFGEGMVNAGKNEQGQLMIFHADKVERIEVRDRAGNVLPEGQKKYRRVNLTFVMESGRTNPRPMNVLTAKQLQKVREVIGK
jgi:hypothetical protein